MCEALQRTYDAGLSADGVLSTEHESGVAHVHQLLLGALGRADVDSVAAGVRADPHPHRRRRTGASRSSTPPTASRSSAACTTCASPTSPTELDVSTGLIHYHFATKDELIEAMLRDAAERRGRGGRGVAGRALDTPEDRLASDRSRSTCRRCGGIRSWVLWIDVWGEALRDANLRRISEELDAAWVELIAEVIAEGVESRGVPPRRPGGVRRGGCAPCSTASACRSCCTTAR